MSDTLALGTVLVPSDGVVARVIEGDVIIVPLVAGIGDTGDELYTLNDTGRAVWDRLDGRRTLADVVSALAAEFDASREEIEADAVGFATELVRRGILTVVA